MADRFSKEIYKPGVTYSADSFQENMFIPMQMRERENTYLNEMADVRTKAYNIPVPKNEQAKAYFEEFVNKTDSEIDNLTNSIATNGVLDPSKAGSLRALKANYAKETSLNGGVGYLSDLKKRMDDQYGMRSQQAMSENYSGENFERAWEMEQNNIYNNIDWDKIGTSEFVGPDFKSNFAPKNIKIMDFYRENLDMLGNISNSIKTNMISEPTVVNGVLMITDQNGNELTSTNVPNLDEYKQLIQTHVMDKDSDLMKSAIYRALGTDKEGDINAIQNDLLTQLHYMVNSSATTNTELDTRKNITTVNNNKPATQATGGGGGLSSDTIDTGVGMVGGLGISSIPTGHADLPESVINNMGAYADGSIVRELEAQEQRGDFGGKTPEEFAKLKNAAVAYTDTAKRDLYALSKDKNLKQDIYGSAIKGMVNGNSAALINALGPTYKKNRTGGINQVDINGYNKAVELRKLTDSNIKTLDPNNVIGNIVNNKRWFDNLVDRVYNKSTEDNGVFMVTKKGEVVNNLAHLNTADRQGAVQAKNANEAFNIALSRQGISLTQDQSNRYLENKAKYDISSEFTSSVDSIALKQYKEKIGSGFKLNSQLYTINYGGYSEQEQTKIGNDINKSINLNTSALISVATNNNGLIAIGDSPYTAMGDGDHNRTAEEWQTYMVNPEFKLEGFIDNGPGTKPELQFSVSYEPRGGQGKMQGKMSVPYTYSADNTYMDDMFNNVEKTLDPYSAAKLRALRNNAKTEFLYVDDISAGNKGVSKNQKDKMILAGKTINGENVSNNADYTRVNPIQRPGVSKANITYVPSQLGGDNTGGLYKVNYVENGTNKTVTGGDYLYKSVMAKDIESGKYNREGGVYNKRAIENPLHAEAFVVKMIEFSELMKNGVIKFEDYNVTSDNYNQFVNAVNSQGSSYRTLDEKYALAKTFFSEIENKTILHKSKTELL